MKFTYNVIYVLCFSKLDGDPPIKYTTFGFGFVMSVVDRNLEILMRDMILCNKSKDQLTVEA